MALLLSYLKRIWVDVACQLDYKYYKSIVLAFQTLTNWQQITYHELEGF